MLVLRRRCGDTTATIAVTERSDGDCAPIALAPNAANPVSAGSAAVAQTHGVPVEGGSVVAVTVLRQVHGARVVAVDQPGDHHGDSADAAWTSTRGAMLAVRTADCVPIALYGSDANGRGALAAVHAGWRGLLTGIVRATLVELKRHGIRNIRAVIGPHICPLHYEFGIDQLDAARQAFGPSVVGTTQWGTPALDLGEAARSTLRRNGAVVDSDLERCTASDRRYFSHRTRQEQGRTAMLVCLEGATNRAVGG